MVGYPGIKILSGDKRKSEAQHWAYWLSKVPRMRREFGRWGTGFDPFEWNEAASVAALANAAVKAGYLAHTEYISLKRRKSRGRPYRHGRCDLWLADVDSKRSWAFEVKQHFAAARIRQSTFDTHLERARMDAKDLDHREADDRVGCLILVPKCPLEKDPHHIERYDNLCMSSDIAFRINGGIEPIWIAFVIV